MTSTFVSLTEDEFDQQCPLLRNHLNPTASWAFEDGIGCLFETYGEELDFVSQRDPQTVWRLVDSEDGDLYVVNALHFFNRVGYLLSEVAVPDDFIVEVHIPMDSGDEP